jgi:hypothetical protein
MPVLSIYAPVRQEECNMFELIGVPCDTKLESCHCEARPGATGPRQVVSSIIPVWARERSDVAIYIIEPALA